MSSNQQNPTTGSIGLKSDYRVVKISLTTGLGSYPVKPRHNTGINDPWIVAGGRHIRPLLPLPALGTPRRIKRIILFTHPIPICQSSSIVENLIPNKVNIQVRQHIFHCLTIQTLFPFCPLCLKMKALLFVISGCFPVTHPPLIMSCRIDRTLCLPSHIALLSLPTHILLPMRLQT